MLTRKISKYTKNIRTTITRADRKFSSSNNLNPTYGIDASNPEEIYITAATEKNTQPEKISSIHDIPYKNPSKNSFNMVVEIP